ncbi:MAG TPA: DUF1653 domain-containing protein [Candidatus Paceibacterota bacterium]
MQTSTRVPDKGFYYHYKHDPSGSVNNYAYEVLGTGLHSEGSHGVVDPKDMLVVYRPIYEAFVFKEGELFDIRPLDMFMENVIKDGKTFPRFQKISDAKIIGELERIKKEMYGLD